MTKKKLLLLTNAHQAGWIDDPQNNVSTALREFKKRIDTQGQIDAFISTVDALRFSVTSAGVVITDTQNNIDLREYDVVHFRNISRYWDFAKAISIYMHAHNKMTLEPVDENIPEYGKISQMVLFALNDIPVPDTFCAWHLDDLRLQMIEQNVEYPSIVKSNKGIMGKDNYLVRDDAEFASIIDTNDSNQFVGQRFIPNDGDYRVLFFGYNSHPLIFKRTAQGGSHLNNTSRGGLSEEIPYDAFDQKALSLSMAAAKVTRRLFAGVDVMQDQRTGEWIILEVNANPALSSGSLPDEKAKLYSQFINNEAL